MTSTAPTDDRWLAALLRILPVPDTFWHRQLDWDAADPTDDIPRDFRAVFDVYDTHQFVVERHDPDSSPRLLSLHLPLPEEAGGELRPAGDPWARFPDADWNIAGVTRSTDAAWADLPLPKLLECRAAWGRHEPLAERTASSFLWAPGHDGRRATIVVSTQRPEAWVLAMPVAEIVVRFLSGQTGCPWLDGPNAGDEHWEPEATIAVPWTHEDPPVDQRDPAPYGRWVQGGLASTAEPAAVTAPAVEILHDGSIPAATYPQPAAGDIEQDLQRLRELVAPPAEPSRFPDWETLEALLEAPVTDDLRALLDTYGEGTITNHDPDADWPVRIALEGFANHITLVSQTVLEFVDAHDLLGDQPLSDLRAIAWCTVEIGEMHELWVYSLGGIAGLARSYDDNVRRISGSAPRQLADAITGDGQFNDLERDTDLTQYPPSFTPR